MPAYLIAEHIATEDAKFEKYVTKVRPMIAKHGGRYLTPQTTWGRPLEAGARYHRRVPWHGCAQRLVQFAWVSAAHRPS